DGKTAEIVRYGYRLRCSAQTDDEIGRLWRRPEELDVPGGDPAGKADYIGSGRIASARNDILTISGRENIDIFACLAVERVIPFVAGKTIVARAAIQHIVARTPDERVIRRKARNCVVA